MIPRPHPIPMQRNIAERAGARCTQTGRTGTGRKKTPILVENNTPFWSKNTLFHMACTMLQISNTKMGWGSRMLPNIMKRARRAPRPKGITNTIFFGVESPRPRRPVFLPGRAPNKVFFQPELCIFPTRMGSFFDPLPAGPPPQNRGRANQKAPRRATAYKPKNPGRTHRKKEKSNKTFCAKERHQTTTYGETLPQ